MSLYSKFLGFSVRCDLDWIFLNAEDDKAASAMSREIYVNFQQRSYAIFFHIEDALKAARCLHLTNGQRKIRSSTVLLTRTPSDDLGDEIDINLVARINYDPKAFFELPNDHRIIGETLLDCIEQGLSILSTYPNYPAEVIRRACESFRENDYTYKLFSPKPMNIEGTKLKGRIDTYIDAVSLRRDLTVSYRGKEFLTKTISRFDRINAHSAACHHCIELDNRIVRFCPLSQGEYKWWSNRSGPYPIQEPVELDLNDFPELLDFIIEKGWTS